MSALVCFFCAVRSSLFGGYFVYCVESMSMGKEGKIPIRILERTERTLSLPSAIIYRYFFYRQWASCVHNFSALAQRNHGISPTGESTDPRTVSYLLSNLALTFWFEKHQGRTRPRPDPDPLCTAGMPRTSQGTTTAAPPTHQNFKFKYTPTGAHRRLQGGIALAYYGLI